MKLAPYWLENVTAFQSDANAPVEGRFDVAVIGAGFTGLSAALSLAKRGASVAVLEAGRVGGAASGRNGGQCNNGLAFDFGSAVGRFGLDRARDLYRAFDAAVDSVERIVIEERISCDFKRTGKIKLAAKPEHFEKLKRNRDILAREVDPDTTLIAKSDLCREIGSDHFHGGLTFSKSAGLHVGKFVSGLARAACAKGAMIYENAAVTKLKRLKGQERQVVTRRGSLHAAQVLLATGASSVGPFSYFRRRIIPIGSFIIVTEPLEQSLVDELMPTRRMASNSKNVGVYFRITPDNRLLFGGRARFAASNPLSDSKSGEVLKMLMHQIFPQLKNARIDYCWGGIVDMTVDRLPHAGEHDGVFFSMGYSGHGTQMSTHMGVVMADVMNGDPERNVFRCTPWRAIPGNFGRPWFLPFVGAYYRLQDVLH